MSATRSRRPPRATSSRRRRVPRWPSRAASGGLVQAIRRPVRPQRLSGHGPRHEASAWRGAEGLQALFLDLELANFFTQEVDVDKIAHGVAPPKKAFHHSVINGRLVFLVAEMQQARTFCDDDGADPQGADRKAQLIRDHRRRAREAQGHADVSSRAPRGHGVGAAHRARADRERRRPNVSRGDQNRSRTTFVGFVVRAVTASRSCSSLTGLASTGSC